MTKISISAETIIQPVSLTPVLLCLPLPYRAEPPVLKSRTSIETKQDKTKQNTNPKTEPFLNLVLHVTTEAYLGSHLPLSPSLPNFQRRTSIGQLESIFHPMLSNLLIHISLIQTDSCTDSVLFFIHALVNLTLYSFSLCLPIL